MADLTRFYITEDDGYKELSYVLESEDEGEFVRLIEAGNTLAELVASAESFVPMVDQRTGGESDG